MEENNLKSDENKNTDIKKINIKMEKEDININDKKEEIKSEIEKEKIIIKDETSEKIELTTLFKLTEKIQENEENESEKKEKIDGIEQKIEELKEKENAEKEKIEEIEQKLEKIKEEKIKDIKLIPKQELIIAVIHNITPNVSEAHLKEIFSRYGEVKEVYIPINKETQLKKNYAFIEFTKKESSEKAQLYMDEGQIDGKVVRVEILAPKNYIKMK